MSDWHLDQLSAALTNSGWRIPSFHDGDGYSVSGSWEIQRSTRLPPIFIDFDGLDDLRCLPMSESYACRVRGGNPWLYFRRPGEKWRAELAGFVRELDSITRFPRPMLPVRRIEDGRTMPDALEAERAILFLHAEWSMPSQLAWKLFQQWVGERDARVESREAVAGAATEAVGTFVAVNSGQYAPAVVAWLEAQELGHFTCRGAGEILWLASGRIVAIQIWPHEMHGATLTRTTAELWGFD